MAARISALVFALALVFGLSACGGPGNGAAPSGSSQSASAPESSPAVPESSSAASSDTSILEPSAPDREPIGNPAVIDYPELVGEDLAASPLYRQALERPSVITYRKTETEILTNAKPVYDFLAAVEAGKDWDLYIYDFWSYDSGDGCSMDHFVSDKGVVRKSAAFDWSWETFTEEGWSAVGSLALNEYGYLVYGEESGVQVVSDYALYDDAGERHRLKETYIDPIFYTGIASSDKWASPQELGHWLWLFEDIYSYENGSSPWDRYGSDWPVDDMVETLSRYFDGVTAQKIISSGSKPTAITYDPQTNTIHYEGGRGGAPNSVRVTGWTQEEDRLMIDYEAHFYYTGVPEENSGRTLTVRLLEDGSFRYLSNLPRVQ